MGWLPGYSYRKQIPITGQSGAGTDYQVQARAFYEWWDNWSPDADNPIITPSQSWEGNNIYSPTLLKEDSTYRMWWGGFDGTNDRIGYGWSSDGEAWNKFASNPVLNIGSSGAWDDVHVNDPSVVKVGSTYYMFYTGCRVGEQDQIGLATATSPEGPWTKSGSNPVLAKGYSVDEYYVARPTVIYEDNTFKMWYDGRHQTSGLITGVYYATSSDGESWSRQGQALSGQYVNPEVRRVSASEFILACEENAVPRKIRIYRGTNETAWVLKNPEGLGTGTWNPYGSLSVGLINVGDEWWMYFGGATNVGLTAQRIGLSKSKDEGERVCLNGHSRSDFGDVRFTDDDGQTELDYWIEKKADSDYAIFWVEVRDDLGNNQNIYIYYGKGDVTTTSSGLGTFFAFDDHNHADDGDPDFTVLSGLWQILSNEYHNKPTATTECISRRDMTNIANFVFACQFYIVSTGTAKESGGLVFRVSDVNNLYLVEADSSGDLVTLYKKVGGNYTQLGSPASFALSPSIWYKLEARVIDEGTGVRTKVYINDSLALNYLEDPKSHSTGECGYRVYVNSYDRHCKYDDFRVRKYVSPEPIVGTAEQEEESPPPPGRVYGPAVAQM